MKTIYMMKWMVLTISVFVLHFMECQRISGRKARRTFEQFDLIDAGKRPFKAYSKGMKRKLTIAAG